MKKLLLTLALTMGFVSTMCLAQAQAVPLSIFVNVNCPTATSISITPVSPWVVSGSYPNISLTYPGTSPVPVPANSVIGTVVVSPVTGCSMLGPLSGTNASNFALSGFTLDVGPTALPVGSYVVSLPAAP